MRAERGVRDDSTAQAIQGIGDIASSVGDMALAANKQERVGNLGAELEQLNQGILDPADQQRVDAVGTEMNKLANAQKQQPSRTDYTVRAEAILKKHMAAAPALADEFRAKAGVVLGFNPTGSAIDAHFAQQDAIAKAAAAEEAHIRATGKQMGMDTRGDIMKPEWQAEYGRRRAIAAAAWEAKNKPALDDNDIGKAASAMYNDFDGRINETTEAVFGKDWRSITPNEWASLDPANRAEYSNRLVEMKFRLPNEILSAYPNATKEQRDVIANSQIGRIDYLLASLDGSKDAERLANSIKVQGFQATQGVLATPEGLAVQALAGVGAESSPALTASLSSVAVKVAGDIMEAKQRDADPTPPAGPTRTKEIQAGTKFVNSWMRSVDYQSLETEDRKLASDFTSAYTSMLVRGSLNPNEKQTILEAIADPQVKGFIDGLDPTDETLSNVLEGARSYAIESGRGALDELAGFYLNSEVLKGRTKRGSPIQRAAASSQAAAANTDDLVTKLVNGQVVTTAKDGSRTVMSNTMNQKYTKRLNTAIRAMAAAGGMTNEEAANTLFMFRPSAFSWIEGTQQPEQSGGAGQGSLIEPEGTLLQDEEGNKFRVVGGKYVREQ
jgi:hypothetical protein